MSEELLDRCRGCGKAFTERRETLEHQQGCRDFLLGERPHERQCRGCGRRFGDSDDALEHERQCAEFHALSPRGKRIGRDPSDGPKIGCSMCRTGLVADHPDKLNASAMCPNCRERNKVSRFERNSRDGLFTTHKSIERWDARSEGLKGEVVPGGTEEPLRQPGWASLLDDDTFGHAIDGVPIPAYMHRQIHRERPRTPFPIRGMRLTMPKEQREKPIAGVDYYLEPGRVHRAKTVPWSLTMPSDPVWVYVRQIAKYRIGIERCIEFATADYGVDDVIEAMGMNIRALQCCAGASRRGRPLPCFEDYHGRIVARDNVRISYDLRDQIVEACNRHRVAPGQFISTVIHDCIAAQFDVYAIEVGLEHAGLWTPSAEPSPTVLAGTFDRRFARRRAEMVARYLARTFDYKPVARDGEDVLSLSAEDVLFIDRALSTETSSVES